MNTTETFLIVVLFTISVLTNADEYTHYDGNDIKQTDNLITDFGLDLLYTSRQN